MEEKQRRRHLPPKWVRAKKIGKVMKNNLIACKVYLFFYILMDSVHLIVSIRHLKNMSIGLHRIFYPVMLWKVKLLGW